MRRPRQGRVSGSPAGMQKAPRPSQESRAGTAVPSLQLPSELAHTNAAFPLSVRPLKLYVK